MPAKRLKSHVTSGPRKVFLSASCLQGCRGGDDTDDDEHYINRYVAWFQSEDEHQDEYTYHTIDTQSDAPYSGTDEHHCSNDRQL